MGRTFRMRAAGITRRVAAAATAAILMIGVLAAPALGSTPVFQLDFPKGQACAGFALHIDGYDPVGGTGLSRVHGPGR